MTVIAVLGAGPHGRAIADDMYSPWDQRCITCNLYDDEIPAYRSIEQGAEHFVWVAGLAWPWTRRVLVERIEAVPRLFGPWNDGIVILAGAQISRESVVGRHVHILHNVVISHGCNLGDFTTVCSGAVLSGDVQVGEGVLIGANATVLHGGITIGDGAKIGAGAVVVSDVEAGDTVVGNPAVSTITPWQKMVRDGQSLL